MRLLVLGATGRTGRELVEQALRDGHEVTGLVRDRSVAFETESERLSVVEGNVCRTGDVERAVQGHDAVLSVLGVNSPKALLRPRLMREAMHAVVPAMERHRVSRLVLLSALGAGASRPSAPFPLRLAFSTVLRRVGADKAASEELLQASRLEWTIVYPPALTDGPCTGVKAGEALDLRGIPRVSRADVAAFMLRVVSDGSFVRARAVLGPREDDRGGT
jgi:uncharacterized protein YbjT (DUF2867 family)